MSRAWLLGVFLSLAIGCKGDAEGERRDRCRDVRDKIVDLELDRRLRADERSRAPERAAILEKHRDNLQASLGDAFVERCAREDSPAYVACVLAAGDADEASRCRKEVAR
jgi:hypothetical protein